MIVHTYQIVRYITLARTPPLKAFRLLVGVEILVTVIPLVNAYILSTEGGAYPQR